MAKVMEQKIKGRTVAFVALGALVALLFLRKKPAAAAQGVSGAIQGISIDGAPMGAHLIPKLPGQNATVAPNWTGTTKNAAGVGITWFYRVAVWLENASGNIVAQPVLSDSLTGLPGVAQETPVVIQVPASAVPGQFLTGAAQLQALTSDAQGFPTATWTTLGPAVKHVNAIQVAGAAVPGGAINVVNVAQRRGF